MNQEDEQERGTSEAQPRQSQDHADLPREASPPLSQMLAELKSQFGPDFDENDAFFILSLEQALSKRKGLSESLRGKPSDEAMQTFSQALPEILQATFETPHKLYKNIKEDKEFENHLTRKMFKRFQQRVTEEPTLPQETERQSRNE